MKSVEISLEGDVNDRLSSLRYLTAGLSPLRDMGSGDTLLLNLSKLHYIGPDGIVMITGSVLVARRNNVEVQVLTPTEPAPLKAFLEFSGFNHWMNHTPVPTGNHPENVTIPLRQYRQSSHSDPDPIIELVSRFSPVSDDLQLSLGIAVAECIQNVEDHSQSSLGAVGCARFMRKSKEVRVALIDWGVGILTSLQRRYPDIRSSRDALECVLYGGYSAKTRMNNQGRGIDNLRAVITDSFGGDLFIASGNGPVNIRNRRKPRYSTWNCDFPGTAVCFTLPVRPRPQTR